MVYWGFWEVVGVVVGVDVVVVEVEVVDSLIGYSYCKCYMFGCCLEGKFGVVVLVVLVGL